MFKLAFLFSAFFLLSYTSGMSALAKINNSVKTEFDVKSLPLIGIRLNGGAKFTNQKTLEVEIKSLKTDKSLIESMEIGFEPELSGTNWKPYTEEIIKMQITGGEGEKRVYVRLKDKAGNISPIESNKIIYDTSPPINLQISINKGSKYSNDKLGRVLVEVHADDASELMISNSEQLQNAKWESYKESLKWIIDVGGGDGEKNVYVKFRDAAGNETEVISDNILLDLTPPVGGSITINDGATYTKSKNLRLRIGAKDADIIRVVSRGVGKNYEYKPDNGDMMNILWETDSAEGVKSVKVYFMDEAKNTTKIPAEASIIYSITPPKKPTVTINQGSKYTNITNGTVSLQLVASQAPQNLRMLISNQPNFEGAKERPFVTSIQSWQLDAEEDGLKTVYVRLIDRADNISEAGKAEIFLDRSAPNVNSFTIENNAAWCIGLKVMLTSDVDDAHEAQYSNNSSALRNIKWEPFAPTRADWTILPGDGEKIVYARFRDHAGNVTEIISAKIMLDMTPPSGDLMLDGGKKFTNDPTGLVTVQIKRDDDVVGMQITNLPDFTDAKLLPFEEKIENWKLNGEEDGQKTVFVRLKDKAGNFSKIYASGITLDRQAPTNCELIINNNDPFVRNENKRVSLSLRAEGADYMMISNSETMQGGQWIPFKTAIAWTLEGREGVHQVYAKFKDEAGNESNVISKSVKSDFAPPKILKFSINNQAEFCNDPQNNVTLTIDVEDAVMMAVSNTHLNDTAVIKGLWEPYKTSKEWKLDGEDGLKIVYARFKDEAGNVTYEYYDKIVLDRIPPSEGRVAINNGAEWFTNKEGKGDIQLFANGASEVMLSQTADFSGAKWEPINEVYKDWIFNTKGSTVVIYAKFKDAAGNVSEAVSASSNVDLDPPKNAAISIDKGAKYVMNKERKINIELIAEEASGMRISKTKNFADSRWEPYVPNKEMILNEPDGVIVYYAQFSDDAGNYTDPVSTSIILDTTPPNLKMFTINNGEEWTNAPDKKVGLKIEAEGAAEMMICDNPELNNCSWESFKPAITDYVLSGEDGEKVLFIRLKDEQGNESKVAAAKINLKRSF